MAARAPVRARAAGVALAALLALAACEAPPGGPVTGPASEGYVVVENGQVVEVIDVQATPPLPVTQPRGEASVAAGCPPSASVIYGGTRYCRPGSAGP